MANKLIILFNDTNDISSHIDPSLGVFRQGDVGHEIYCHFENFANYNYGAYTMFERADGSKSPELPMTLADFTYSGTLYSGFKLVIDDEWIMAQDGSLKATVRVRNASGTVVASSLVPISLEKTVYEAEPTITAAQYNILLSYFDKYLPKVSRNYPHIVSELPSNIAEYLTQGQIIGDSDIPEDLTDYEVGAILFVEDDVYEIYDDGGTKDIRLLDTLENYLVGTIFIVLTESVFELHKVVNINQTELITSTQVHEYLDRTEFPEEGRANHLYIDATESHIYFCDENYTYRLIGTKAVDVKTAYSPLNYYVDETNVDSHFNGIDDKFSKIADGTSLVGKAEQDANGNVINTHYATKSEYQNALIEAGLRQLTSQKNKANGYVGLDSNTKIPTLYLPDSILGQLEYKGSHNCSTGAYPLNPEKGWYYICSTGGTISGVSYIVGDWLVYNGSSWDKIDNTDAVASVNTKMGVVVLDGSDIKVKAGVDNTTLDVKVADLMARLTALLGVSALQDTAIEIGGTGVYSLSYSGTACAITPSLLTPYNWVMIGVSVGTQKEYAIFRPTEITNGDNVTMPLTSHNDYVYIKKTGDGSNFELSLRVKSTNADSSASATFKLWGIKPAVQEAENVVYDETSNVKVALDSVINSKIDKMTLLNMLLNNNFESSTSWMGVNGTITDVSSNVLTLTGNSPTATYTSIVQSIARISGHKYYMKSWMRCADIGNSSLRISWANQLVTFSAPSPDVWYDINGIITSDASGNSNFQFQLLNTVEKVENKVLYIKKGMLIDLTDVFGAGKEPTLQAINEVLSEYGDGWFNIALTLSLAEQIKLLPATETLITNKIKNGNFTSLNEWTTVNGTMTVTDNVATLLGNVTASNMSLVQVFPTIANHKYYFHIFAKISGAGTIRMAFGTPTYASLFNDFDVWHEVSTVYQAPSTTFNFLIQLLATDVDTMTLQAKSIVSIDLTAVFGAGKEPTTRQMDYVINSFPDSFFDGSTSLINDNIINSLLEYSAVPTKGKSLLCFGDSITQTATVSNDGATYTEGNRTNWPTFTKVDLELSSMFNYAKAGASFEEKSEDDMQKVTYQISSAIANSRAGDIIVVSAGTNDRVGVDNMSDYNTAMGKATLADLDRTKVYEALRWCFWTIKENYPNAICFCATPIQRASSEQPPELIEAITKMARRYNFIIIDAFNESGIVRENEVVGDQGVYLYDGTHPDINGQRLLANLYSAKILEYFIK